MKKIFLSAMLVINRVQRFLPLIDNYTFLSNYILYERAKFKFPSTRKLIKTREIDYPCNVKMLSFPGDRLMFSGTSLLKVSFEALSP